jgi:uncharacterized membrane protein YphA (DoxX/SURF4 family)
MYFLGINIFLNNQLCIIHMEKFKRFEKFHLSMKSNRWHLYFSIFCRISLAIGFFAAGMVKIVGERFASGLSELHPMGAYLEALHHTGYYYTFIGIVQVIVAILLIIPKTAFLGAMIYLPVILNIFVLSYALRFDGSYLPSPLMLLANIYILVWHYDKLKYILPLQHTKKLKALNQPNKLCNKFPYKFFGFVLITIVSIVLYARFGNDIMPRNSYSDCLNQNRTFRANHNTHQAFC